MHSSDDANHETLGININHNNNGNYSNNNSNDNSKKKPDLNLNPVDRNASTLNDSGNLNSLTAGNNNQTNFGSFGLTLDEISLLYSPSGDYSSTDFAAMNSNGF